jgi:hypothetical protein
MRVEAITQKGQYGFWLSQQGLGSVTKSTLPYFLLSSVYVPVSQLDTHFKLSTVSYFPWQGGVWMV